MLQVDNFRNDRSSVAKCWCVPIFVFDYVKLNFISSQYDLFVGSISCDVEYLLVI